jgi:arylsulfatase A-like enzyme/thioredoxin-like negative regulator of GroEL
MRILQPLLCVVALCGSLLCAPVPRPNVILITIDTTRADRMGFMGSTKGLTPNLDALAKQGIVFTRAYSQVPLTSPSHVAILSGTYPQFNHVNDFGMPLAKAIPYLPQVLHDHGYKTAAFVGSVILDPKSGAVPGFERGFDTYAADFSATKARSDRYQTLEHRGGDVVAEALTWLKDNSRGPTFLWIHLFDPHAPYDPPEPFKSRYASSPYDGEIAYADSALGNFFDGLKKRGLFDAALIAVMADHGEAFGEHGERNHGIFLYDETIHVPLVFKMPAEKYAGKRIEDRARLVDVAPTILASLFIPSPKTMQGESLLPLIKPAATAKVADRTAYSETDYPYRDFGWSSLRSLRTGKYLVVEAPRKELYDEAADPQSTHDIASTAPAITQTLMANLDQFRQKTASSGKGQEVAATPQLQHQLAALGYVSSSSVLSSGPDASRADPKDKIEVANLVQQAMLARESGQPQQAAKALEQALAKDPNNTVVNRTMGTIFMDQQDPPRAMPYLRKATELSPDSAIDHYNLGMAYFSTGDVESAKTQLEAAVAKSTAENLQSLGNLHYTLAAAYSRLGRPDDAKRELRKSIALQPEDYDSNLIMGKLLAESDAEAAIPYLLTAAKSQPAAPDPHVLLFQLYTTMGQADKAAKERQLAEQLEREAKP